jgi:4-amino-4-deoxychorismate lyase
MSDLLAVLVNGESGRDVSTLDRGLHYGDGVFETIAVRAGTPLLWNRHLRRLQAGAARLGMAPPRGDMLKAWATRVCAGHDRAVLKLIVTRGIGGRGYRSGPTTPTAVVLVYAWPEYPPNVQDGIAVRICDTRLAHQPRLAGIKHLNRLEQVLARAEWEDDFGEGLMLDQTDYVIEGTMSNLFAVIDNELRTPDLQACGVAGVMRGLVLETASAWLPARVAPLRSKDLMRASEVFLTNSLIGIWPVGKLVDRLLAPGPIARRLQLALRAHYVEG